MIDPKLIECAEELVRTAEIHAVAAYTPITDEFPFLEAYFDDPEKLEHWDFIVTTATIFAALKYLEDEAFDAPTKQTLVERASAHIQQWQPEDGLRGLEDCKSFVAQSYQSALKHTDSPELALGDSVGMWIAWNILGRPSESAEERNFTRSIGQLVTQPLADWWKAAS